MAYNRRDDDLAYGDYQGRPAQGSGEGESDRGFIGDVGKRLFGGRKQSEQGQQVRFNMHIAHQRLLRQHQY